MRLNWKDLDKSLAGTWYEFEQYEQSVARRTWGSITYKVEQALWANFWLQLKQFLET